MNPIYIGTCYTCSKFKTPQCPDGVVENGAADGWDGRDGGCSLWLHAICKDCRHMVHKGIQPNRSSFQCECGGRNDWHGTRCYSYKAIKPEQEQLTLGDFR